MFESGEALSDAEPLERSHSIAPEKDAALSFRGLTDEIAAERLGRPRNSAESASV